MDTLLVIWLIVIVGFAVLEAMTPGMVAICFSIAGLGALLAYFIGASLLVQLIVYVIVLGVCLYFLIPVLKRLSKLEVDDQNQKHVKTNLDLVIGELGEALSDISFLNEGVVKVDGKEWTAKVNHENESISKGDVVKVKAISGSKIIVEKK